MKTKIISTISPKILNNKEILSDLLHSGTDIIRVNLKYIDVNDYDELRKKVLKSKHDCKLLVDIKNRGKLKQIINKKFDYLAVSFAELPSEIVKIKKMFSKNVKIISKIESKKGVKNIDSLIQVSDGIMIARGDLGESIPIERVPIVQKLITKKCNKKKKMSITSTEMMPSMVTNKRPTRAEVSDVANAILEGAEVLMLAEETAIGNHPGLVVRTMKKIITEIDKEKRKLKK